MKRNGTAVLLCGFFLLTTAGGASGAGMKAGLWEINSTMEMPGLPFQPPPTTITHCYTSEDVKSNERMVPQQGDCKVTEFKRTGGKITWKILCTGEQKGSGSGEMTFKGDSAYEGTMTFRTDEMTMTSRYKARRLGDCK